MCGYELIHSVQNKIHLKGKRGRGSGQLAELTEEAMIPQFSQCFLFPTGKQGLGSECLIDTIADGEMNRMKALYSNTKRRMTTAFFIMICLCLVLFVEGALAEAPGTGRALADRKAELIQMMNLNLRYILQTWWHAEKDFVYAAATNMNSDQQLTEERTLAIKDSARAFADWENADVLPILYLSREQAENGIRPVSHAIYCISLS